jgi:hypothetical protein
MRKLTGTRTDDTLRALAQTYVPLALDALVDLMGEDAPPGVRIDAAREVMRLPLRLPVHKRMALKVLASYGEPLCETDATSHDAARPSAEIIPFPKRRKRRRRRPA